jgi:hypothetical protein
MGWLNQGQNFNKFDFDNIFRLAEMAEDDPRNFSKKAIFILVSLKYSQRLKFDNPVPSLQYYLQ